MGTEQDKWLAVFGVKIPAATAQGPGGGPGAARSGPEDVSGIVDAIKSGANPASSLENSLFAERNPNAKDNLAKAIEDLDGPCYETSRVSYQELRSKYEGLKKSKLLNQDLKQAFQGSGSSGSSSNKPAGKSDDDGGPEASVVVDPVAKTVETQVAIDLSYTDSAGKRQKLPVKLTVHVGSNGFQGFEGELTALTKKLKSQIAGGVIRDVTVAISFDAQVTVDKTTANRQLPVFAAKLKSALSADLGIPGTSIKVPVEISVFVDPQGKPGAGVNFTLFKF
jgi:hypothetical protein